MRCTHLESIEVTERPTAVDGCEDCLREGTGWVHLRLCLTCGHVGCCDSSPQRHASGHARSAEHALLTSLQPGEDWSYCFPDDLAMRIPEVTGSTDIPPSPLGG